MSSLIFVIGARTSGVVPSLLGILSFEHKTL